MTIMNNTTEKNTRKLANQLVRILTGKENQPFLIVNYDLHPGSSLMLPTYTVSVLPDPIKLKDNKHEILLYAANYSYQFIGINNQWIKNKGEIRIPINSTVVDIAELVGNDEMKKKEMFSVPQKIWKENALNFYFGMDAIKFEDVYLNNETRLIEKIKKDKASYQKTK